MASFDPLGWLVTYDLLEAIVIILFTIVIGKVSQIFLKQIVFSITARTKTSLDDDMVNNLKGPVFMGMFLFGLYIAVTSINYLEVHMPTLNKVFVILGIILIFYIVHKVLAVVVKWYTLEWSPKIKGEESKQLTIFGKVADIVLFIIFGLVILGYLGIDVTPIMASLGIGGLAVALALQETLRDFFAGLSIIGDKSIKVGDYIELEGGLGGYVDDISWRTSRIKTLGNDFVLIPNSKLAQSVTTDYNFGTAETFIGVEMGIGYDADLDKVEKIAKKVAIDVQKTVEGAVKDFEPNPRYRKFNTSTIEMAVFLKASKFSDKFLIRHEFIKRIMKEFRKNKIVIPYQIMDVNLKKGK